MAEESEISAGGIIIPPTALQERAVVGEVVAVSDGYVIDDQDIDPLFSLGDVVVVGKYVGTELLVGQGRDRKKVLIVREKDVLAVLGTASELGTAGARVRVAERD